MEYLKLLFFELSERWGWCIQCMSYIDPALEFVIDFRRELRVHPKRSDHLLEEDNTETESVV
jgi:hypothetical protein